MHKYYSIAALYPAITAVLIYSIYSHFDNIGYESEWMTADAATSLSIMYSIAYTVIISLCCLPIYFVKLSSVKNRNWLTFLAWFAVPSLVMLDIIYHEVRHSLRYDSDLESTIIHSTMLNLPFFMGLIISYLYYRKKNYH